MPLGREFREQFGTLQNPGKLLHTIVIERRVETRTDSGAVVNEWQPYATARALPLAQGGTEQRGVDSFEYRPTYKITSRWIPGIDSTMRVNLNGRVFDILQIDNQRERGRWMDLMVIEGRSHGNE